MDQLAYKTSFNTHTSAKTDSAAAKILLKSISESLELLMGGGGSG